MRPPPLPQALKVNPGVDSDGPRSFGTGDAAEICGIDIRNRIREYRPVEHIYRVSPDTERLLFSKADALFQRGVEIKVARSFNAR